MTPKTSFIVPCLNASETLRRCLESLRLQSGDNELIVVDNGSSDESPSIANELSDHVISDPEATISVLRNKGAKHASGELLVFVDADCVLDSAWLERALAFFEDDNIGMVGSKTHILPEDAPWSQQAWTLHLDRTCDDPNATWIVTRALAVRRDAFQAVGGFDESLITCEDVALGHAIGKEYRIVASKSLAPLHLKDPVSLRELYKKEVWRGKDSLKTSLRNIEKPKEVLSFILPLYFLLATLLSIVGLEEFIRHYDTSFLIIGLAILLGPIAWMSATTALQAGKPSFFFKLFAVYSVYIAARVRTLLP